MGSFTKGFVAGSAVELAAFLTVGAWASAALRGGWCPWTAWLASAPLVAVLALPLLKTRRRAVLGWILGATVGWFFLLVAVVLLVAFIARVLGLGQRR